ncbi:hypothetical protein PRK78_004063 [Emydomyces testavorans]|uniref:Borealin N-terminal domain-containing protein n=1 Tax=Emydomyces testavorans TaxID=2070801 RepID=A0AAF0DKF5_9EURO|nr:hypothetical protein PRK78_004063 [Emydomyces testavorans]
MSLNPSEKRRASELDAFDDHEARTPVGSPPRKRLRITQRQKQALIDNLQLEITERARKLRAHYALQAQDLRSRIERRVNRIPVTLRKKSMGELLAKYQETVKAEAPKTNPLKMTSNPSPFKKAAMPAKTTKPAQSSDKVSGNGGKRTASKAVKATRQKSDVIHSSDKENAPCPGSTNSPLANPKKRGKAGATGGTARVISQHVQGSVLSPKSSNSRTFPQSPLKQSPVKSQPYKSHPTSPLKPSFGNLDENTKAKATRAPARKILSPQDAAASKRPSSAASLRMKRAAAAKSTATTSTTRKTISRPATRQQHARTASSSTTASSASAGTTIVRSTRSGTTTRKAAAAISASATTTKKMPTPRGQTGTAASNAKKAAATTGMRRGLAVEPPPPGRRVLRKRA